MQPTWQWRAYRDSSRGFTLIELLVVIAIIAVLAAMILAALSSSHKKARDTQRKSDLHQYQAALAQYNGVTGAYPLQASATVMSGSNVPYTAVTGTYMAVFLGDPVAGRSYHYVGSAGQFGICTDLEQKSGQRFEVGATVAQETAGVALTCGLLN